MVKNNENIEFLHYCNNIINLNSFLSIYKESKEYNKYYEKNTGDIINSIKSNFISHLINLNDVYKFLRFRNSEQIIDFLGKQYPKIFSMDKKEYSNLEQSAIRISGDIKKILNKINKFQSKYSPEKFIIDELQQPNNLKYKNIIDKSTEDKKSSSIIYGLKCLAFNEVLEKIIDKKQIENLFTKIKEISSNSEEYKKLKKLNEKKIQKFDICNQEINKLIEDINENYNLLKNKEDKINRVTAKNNIIKRTYINDIQLCDQDIIKLNKIIDNKLNLFNEYEYISKDRKILEDKTIKEINYLINKKSDLFNFRKNLCNKIINDEKFIFKNILEIRNKYKKIINDKKRLKAYYKYLLNYNGKININFYDLNNENKIKKTNIKELDDKLIFYADNIKSLLDYVNNKLYQSKKNLYDEFKNIIPLVSNLELPIKSEKNIVNLLSSNYKEDENKESINFINHKLNKNELLTILGKSNKEIQNIIYSNKLNDINYDSLKSIIKKTIYDQNDKVLLSDKENLSEIVNNFIKNDIYNDFNKNDIKNHILLHTEKNINNNKNNNNKNKEENKNNKQSDENKKCIKDKKNKINTLNKIFKENEIENQLLNKNNKTTNINDFFKQSENIENDNNYNSFIKNIKTNTKNNINKFKNIMINYFNNENFNNKNLINSLYYLLLDLFNKLIYCLYLLMNSFLYPIISDKTMIDTID